jgi:KDO2-lipid IV(A) lauroyltransferase
MALLARRTEAPVIPVFLVREKSGFMAEFGSEIPLIKTEDIRKDLEANTQQYNRIIEDIIRRYPDQWFWVHQRWKTKPYCQWPRRI